jgi:hypothetical protein
MGRSKIGGRREPDKVERLTAQVAELTARLEALEGSPRASENGNGNGHDKAPQSRRDLLKLAGAAAAGAAGSIVLGAIPAAATQGSALLMGTPNDATATTDVFPNGAPAPLLQATGQNVLSTTTVPATVSTASPTAQSIPLIGAIGPGGTLPLIGSPAVQDYPGYAPIQGVGGSTIPPGETKPHSEGINGWGAGSIGIGVTGESDTGYGIVGGSGGIDIAALGNGRVLQLSLPGGPPPALNWLANSPAGPPTYTPNDFEQVRDGNGVLWLSGALGTWRRANSLRVDTPTGLAPFTPARLIDTRSSTGTAGSSPGLGANQPLQPGVTYTFGPFTNRNGLPADAVGIVGNLTAVGYTGAGYVTIFPAGVAAPATSSLNFAPPFASSGWANACTVGFGTGANAGKISIRLSNNGITSHVILDVTAYLQ